MIEHLRNDEQVTLPIATFDTPISDNLDTLQIELEPKQEFNGYDHPWVGGAGKNLLNTSTVTKNNITYTQSADGSITASPNNTDPRTWGYSSAQYFVTLPAGSYNIVVQTITPTTSSSRGLQVYASDGTTVKNAGTVLNTVGTQTYPFTLSETTDIGVLCKQYDAVYRLMITKSTESTDYSPYENICPIYPANGKNLLEITQPSGTSSGVTYTINPNGSVTISGTASGVSLYRFGSIPLKSGETYTLSGNDSIVQMSLRDNTGGTVYVNNLTTYTPTSDVNAWYFYRVASGQSVNVTLYPMVRHTEITDSTYVPYNAIGITRTGKNLFNKDSTPLQGYINGSGKIIASSNDRIIWVSVFPNNTYTFSMQRIGQISGQPTDDCYLALFNQRAHTVGAQGRYLYSAQGNVTYTFTPQNGEYWLAVKVANITRSDFEATASTAQVEVESSATQYEPYTAERYYPISDNPVYGGTLDVTTGVLTVDRGYVVFDGTEVWDIAPNDPNAYIYRNMPNGVFPTTSYPFVMSNEFKPATTGAERANEGTIWGMYRQLHVHVPLSIAPSGITAQGVTEWKAWLASHNMQVVYELATPLVYQLTPQQIKTLIGTNNIWSDSGGILHVGYRAMTEPSDSDYGTEVLTPTEDNPYLWNYERIAFTDGTHVDQEKHILAVYGSAGKSIQNVTEYYALSTGTTAPEDSSFSTTVQIPTTTNKYVWNYEKITFTDRTEEVTEKRIIGVYGNTGATGATGRGVESVVKQYYQSTSSTQIIGGSWVDTVPTIDPSKFLWTRDKITYTTGDVTYTSGECVTKYTSEIVAPDISSAITTANDYSAGLVTTERDARLEAIETITTNYENLASTVSSNSTSISTNAKNIELRATKTEVTQLSDALDEVQQFRTTTTNYLTFDATHGLIMSATINGVKSPVESIINNSAWQLVASGKVVQQVDAYEGAQFSAIVLKALSENDIPTLTLGHLVISVQTNGTVIGKKA